MFIKDGDKSFYGFPCEYAFAWGWVGCEVKNTNSWKSNFERQSFIDKFNSITNDGMNPDYKRRGTKGIHYCEMCKEPLGNAQITISHGGILYNSPNAVLHYVYHHGYCPPSEVIDAVMNGVFLKEKDLMHTANDWMVHGDSERVANSVLKRAILKGLVKYGKSNFIN